MQHNNGILLPQYPPELERAHKDRRQRLASYVEWLDAHDLCWNEPTILSTYEEQLLDEGRLKPTSVRVHLSTIRGRYRELRDDPEQFYLLLREHGVIVSSDAFEMEMQKLDEALNAQQTTRRVRSRRLKRQYLSPYELREFLLMRDVTTLKGLRDAAVISLMIATGIREQEVCNVRIEGLRHFSEGELYLHVPPGTGCQERLIPYRNMIGALDVVKAWLWAADLNEGYVFHGFVAHTGRLRTDHLSPKAIQNILAEYPLGRQEANAQIIVKPMDLRRAYAQRLFQEHVPLADIQNYLGLKTGDALLNYLGQVERIPVPHRVPDFTWDDVFTSIVERTGYYS